MNRSSIRRRAHHSPNAVAVSSEPLSSRDESQSSPRFPSRQRCYDFTMRWSIESIAACSRPPKSGASQARRGRLRKSSRPFSRCSFATSDSAINASPSRSPLHSPCWQDRSQRGCNALPMPRQLHTSTPRKPLAAITFQRAFRNADHGHAGREPAPARAARDGADERRFAAKVASLSPTHRAGARLGCGQIVL